MNQLVTAALRAIGAGLPQGFTLDKLFERLQDGTDVGPVLNGAHAAPVAAGDSTPGQSLTFIFNLANAAGDTDIVVAQKVQIMAATFVKKTATGVGSAKTVTLKKGTSAISDALNIAVADKVVVRAGTIDDANHILAAGDTLRATIATSGEDASGILYVNAVVVA